MTVGDFEGPRGDMMRAMIRTAPVPRVGTGEDIAAAAAFLSSADASFVTGTDLLIDGGVTSIASW